MRFSNKLDLKQRLIKWGKNGHYILDKGNIQQENIANISIHAPNNDAPNFIKHYWNKKSDNYQYSYSEQSQ